MKLHCNCCDGVYNSFDVHFTSACDNRCAHCIDMRFAGIGAMVPNVDAIVSTVVSNADGVDDILFLGGEPCLYLVELLQCVKQIKEQTNLKVFVTTSVPKTCYDHRDTFYNLIEEVDGINISVQHYKEDVADSIRRTVSKYDRQEFYWQLPRKEKIRVNLNIVKPYLHTQEDLSACLRHYDSMRFGSIKLSEIQHGEDVYVSFADAFDLDLPSAFSHGCQMYLEADRFLPGFCTPLLLKRSCFLCEGSIPATFEDGVKLLAKTVTPSRNKYGVIYANGLLTGGWV